MMKDKKGIISIEQIVPILVTLLVMAFVIGITVISADELRQDLQTTGTVVNGTVDGAAGNISLGNTLIDLATFDIANISGGTGAHFRIPYEDVADCTNNQDQAIPVLRCGNYTVYGNPGLILFNQTDAQEAAAVYEFNFSHTQNPPASRAVNNTIGSVFNLTEQLPLFGTIIGLFIILGVIFLLVRNKITIGG